MRIICPTHSNLTGSNVLQIASAHKTKKILSLWCGPVIGLSAIWAIPVSGPGHFGLRYGFKPPIIV